MTAVTWPAGAPTGKYTVWASINWRAISMFVKRLQMRVLQRLLKRRDTAG